MDAVLLLVFVCVYRVGPGRYVSIYDGQTEYIMGRTIRCDLKPLHSAGGGRGGSSGFSTGRSASGAHSSRSTTSSWAGWSGDETRGGLFVCRTPEDALAARLPEESALLVAPRALLKVMAWGESRTYGTKTIAFSSLRPVQTYTLGLEYRCAWVAPRTLTSISLSETRKRLPSFHGPQHEAPPTYRARESMGSLTKEIMSMERKITRDTRAQLGW